MSNLSAPELHDHEVAADREPVEVRRNGTLAAAIGVVAAVVALAYLSRAVGGGSWLDWLLALAMGAVGAAYLTAFVDARTPLLVADEQGIRLRIGRTWRGVPWRSIECVEHLPRRGPLRDGRLVLVTEEEDRLLDGLDASGRRQVALARRLHGAPLAVPLSLSTWVTGAGDDLAAALGDLAGDPHLVVEPAEAVADEDYEDYEVSPDYQDDDVEAVFDGTEPADAWTCEEDAGSLDPEEEASAAGGLPDPRPSLARGLDFLADRLRLRRPESEELPHPQVAEVAEVARPEPPAPAAPAAPVVASPTPLPLRDPVMGSRVEVRFEGAAALQTDPVHDEHDDGADIDDVDHTVVWSDRVRPIARPGEPVEPLVIDDLGIAPIEDPVVGPELAAARTRLGLSVDQLAERTRIRPHVIESIEVDDFAPCGGDFYARGHLRTLARVLGVEATPLLAAYDERYADAPIDARRVFEAELATGVDGPIRSTRGGPNWSVLIAAVMALVLAWSIARLIMDSPVELHSKPVLNGSPASTTKLGAPVPVLLNAAAGGVHVVVRDGAGEVVFSGDLAFGEKRSLKAAPPVQVQSSDGALELTVDGEKRGPVGDEGQPAQNTYAAADS